MAELQQESQKELTEAEVVAGEKAFIAQTYKRPPVVLSHGQGMAVWDSEGHEYLDFMAGIAVNALGHNDAGLVAIFAEQASNLIHTSNFFFTLPQVVPPKKLTSNNFPDKIFFTTTPPQTH